MRSLLENSLNPIPQRQNLVVCGGPQRGEISLAEIWAVIRKRKWVIASCIGFTLTLATVYCVVAPRRYEAIARVVVNPDSSSPLGAGIGDAVTLFGDPALMQETQVRIMQSDTVAWDVIRQLQLDKKSEFVTLKSREQMDPLEKLPPAHRFALLARFHLRLKVASVPKTALVELRFRSKDPKLAADIVNATA